VNRLSGIARLVRQICLLREQGDAMAATRLEANEFATAVRDLRLAEGLEAVTEAELQAMFVNEERRVADAVVLAELLIPRLAGSLAASAAAGQRPATIQLRAREEQPVPVSRAAETSAGSTAIPDLLDAMLAADSAARRRGNRLAT
jgi:hypothetical protein